MEKDTTTSPGPRILEATAEYFVVDKPAGWLSIPGRDPKTPSILGWLRDHDPDTLPVHRIDRGTSGLLLFARTREFHREASLWFQKGEVRKTYFALAAGSPQLPSFQFRSPIAGGRAITQVRVVEKFAVGGFFAELQIATGKRHQIRIHLANAGHPLLGDVEYAGPVEFAGRIFSRVMLHAGALRLPNGSSYQSDLPADFAGALAHLRAEAA